MTMNGVGDLHALVEKWLVEAKRLRSQGVWYQKGAIAYCFLQELDPTDAQGSAAL